MRHAGLLGIGLLGCLILAGGLVAEPSARLQQEMQTFDAAAAQAMSKEERLAYQQAYKARLEAIAREEGWQPGQNRGFQPNGRQSAPNKITAFGTITYHSGALGTCCQSSFSVGNKYNSALNPAGTAVAPLVMSGSITMASVDMAAASGNAFMSFFDQQAGTTANVIVSLSLPMVTGSNVLTFGSPINYAGSTFLAGVWQFGGDTPNVATGTVAGQGFHGMSINDVLGDQYTDLPTLNGAISVTGDVLTPVELLNFEIGDE